MNGVILKSLGAAETVTGSKHLLQTPEFNLLVDCGLFQGIKELRLQNWNPLTINAWEIDAVILTHAHLDHCGYIPVLIKNGFKGKIYMTAPTAALTELILLDSAKLQEEDAENANQHHYSRHHPAKPLYTEMDARKAFKFFVVCPEKTQIKLNEDVEFRFQLSGHIIGASSVEITCYGRKIVFSGDIGRNHSAILPPPDFYSQADYVVMESTYGDRLHGDMDPYQELEYWINHTLKKGGNIIIPSFAVGRAQELIYMLNLLKAQHRIPMDLPVIMDSPMAASATDIIVHYADDYTTISKNDWLEMLRHVRVNREYSNTSGFIADKRSKIIIAGSGMLTGGRVLEYLKHYVGDAKHTVLIIGFQAEGTRGRALLNKSHELKIHGRYYPVRATTVELLGLSAHADQSELIGWIKKYDKGLKQVFLVHGEPSAQEALRVKISYECHLPVKIMKQNQQVVLFTIEDESPIPATPLSDN